VETVAPFGEAVEAFREAGASTCTLCYQCGKCDVVCPWNRVRDFSMRRVIREATFGLTQVEEEDIWRCTTCGTCTASCPRGVEHTQTGVALRRVASDYGVFPGTAKSIRAVRSSLAADGNPLNQKRAERGDWAKGLPVKPFSEGMEFLYFVGCYYSYDPRMRKAAVATATVLSKAGVDFGILGAKESCCGESVRKTGSEKAFRSLARENIKTFIDHGVKKIVVSSPHCYHTFANEYPEFMARFEVVHMSQLLAGLIREGRLKLTGEFARKVTWHDPCYLGRRNGIYEEPREVLRSVPGLELVEMSDSRNNSLCCGGGGGRIWMDTPRKERFSNIRLAQAKDAGAQVLATCCPYCITHFEEGRLDMEGEGIEVRDLTEIVLTGLSGPDGAPSLGGEL